MGVQKIIMGLSVAWVIFHCEMEQEMAQREFATNLEGFIFYSGDPPPPEALCISIFESQEEKPPEAMVDPNANLLWCLFLFIFLSSDVWMQCLAC